MSVLYEILGRAVIGLSLTFGLLMIGYRVTDLLFHRAQKTAKAMGVTKRMWEFVYLKRGSDAE